MDPGGIKLPVRAAGWRSSTRAIDEASLTPDGGRGRGGELDALALVLELQPVLRMTRRAARGVPGGAVVARWPAPRSRPTTAGRRRRDLLHADFQTVERAMTEGHPCFVANNGRLGFGVHEYLSYAPETASPSG